MINFSFHLKNDSIWLATAPADNLLSEAILHATGVLRSADRDGDLKNRGIEPADTDRSGNELEIAACSSLLRYE